MKHETDNYIVHFETRKKRFTAICKASGESLVIKQKSVAGTERAMVALSKMKDCDIDAMCDSDFKR